MDCIKFVYKHADFFQMVRKVIAAPPTPAILDQYVRLALELNAAFGTMASIRVARDTAHELVLWHPCSEAVIVVTTARPTEAYDAAMFAQNGSVYIRGTYEDELEGYSEDPSVRPEHEGYMLRLLSLGVFAEQPSRDQQDLL